MFNEIGVYLTMLLSSGVVSLSSCMSHGFNRYHAGIIVCSTSGSIGTGISLLQADLVSSDQVDNLEPLAVRNLLDESVTSEQQIR